MTDPTLAAIRARHVKGTGHNQHGVTFDICKDCDNEWPCDVVTLAEGYEARLNCDTCNSGHKTLPLKLWDCPECVRLKREQLEARVRRLEGEPWPDGVNIYKGPTGLTMYQFCYYDDLKAMFYLAATVDEAIAAVRAEVWAYKNIVPHTEVCREGWCDPDCLHAKAALATTQGGGTG